MMDKNATEEFRSHFDKVELENRLLEIERVLTSNADEKVEVVQAYFRTIHSLKGTAATLGLQTTSRFLHAYEDAIGMLSREIHQITAVRNTEVFDFFLQGLDLIQRLTSHEVSASHDGIRDNKEIFNFYIRLILEARQIIERKADYFELCELDENLF